MADLGTAFMAPLLANQQYLQNEKLLPVELAQKAASGRYTTALADRMETETAGEKRMAALMAAQQAATGGGQGVATDSISGKLMDLSSMFAQAGLPTKATDMMAKASQAASHESTARAAEVRAKMNQFTMQSKQIEQVTKLLDGVKDEQSWKAANDTVQQMTGKPSPFADTPYDPDLVRMLKTSALSEYQKQLVALRGKALAADIANKNSEIQHRGAMEGIANERLRVTQQREQRLTKAGGKDIGSPSKMELDAAARLIGGELEGDEKDNAAFSIASEAKVLRRKNPALSADEALRQSLLNAKQSGEFQAGEAKKVFGIPYGGVEPGKFIKGTGKEVDLPKSGKKSDLVEGQTYKGGFTWTKNGWVKTASGGGGGSSGGSSGGEGSDEEDDDDE